MRYGQARGDFPMMQHFRKAMFIIGIYAGLAFPAHAEPARYELDPEHTLVAFMLHHIGYADVLGQFDEVSGGFMFDEEAATLSDLQVTIQAASVDTKHERRDQHVRSKDFLDVEQFPEITFVMTDAEATGANTGKVTGDLTIRGITKPVTLDVTLNKTGEYPFSATGGSPNYVAGVSARGTVKRSDFGMSYAVENGWVGDEVEMIIEVEAIRQ
jgi:polyisoprenoid-binding protein YceI